MNKEERDLTLQDNRLSFKKKFKWFGRDLDWVKSRIQDGEFNNSKFVPDRYEYLLQFKINDIYLSQFSKVGKKELMLNVRKYIFPIISIKEIN